MLVSVAPVDLSAKYLWSIPEHKRHFVAIGDRPQAFIKFANGLFNHNNEKITDSLHHLTRIKELQAAMADLDSWGKKTKEEQEKDQSDLQDSEGAASSILMCTNSTLNMMAYISSCPELTPHFLRVELKDRLASMLLSVLIKLAGPKGMALKVKNPERYHFRPK